VPKFPCAMISLRAVITFLITVLFQCGIQRKRSHWAARRNRRPEMSNLRREPQLVIHCGGRHESSISAHDSRLRMSLHCPVNTLIPGPVWQCPCRQCSLGFSIDLRPSTDNPVGAPEGHYHPPLEARPSPVPQPFRTSRFRFQDLREASKGTLQRDRTDRRFHTVPTESRVGGGRISHTLQRAALRDDRLFQELIVAYTRCRTNADRHTADRMTSCWAQETTLRPNWAAAAYRGLSKLAVQAYQARIRLQRRSHNFLLYPFRAIRLRHLAALL
jgi:hypothetical protein